MTDRLTILFVNRWRGVIGPNIGLRQMVNCCLSRGHRVHVVSPWADEYLDLLHADGAEVHLLEGLEFVPRGINPLAVLGHCIRGLRTSKRLAALVRRLAADLIVVNGENMLFAPRAGRLARVPVAIVMQGARFAALGLAAKVFFRLQKRWVDRYVAISNVVAKGLADVGVGAGKVTTICCGADTDLFAPRSPEAALAAELGIPGGSQVALTVCNLEPRKGVHHLVESFAAVARQAPQAVSVVVGAATCEDDKPYAARLTARVEELGLAGRVIFAGGRRDVPRLLAAADLLAHPSETESFGRVIAEAMACGKPVVGFRVDAVAELVDDGVTGLLAPPFDHAAFAAAIVRLLADRALRERMGQAARERALRLYDLKVNLPAVVDLFEQLARRHQA